jgi:hypothetical protein
MAKHTPTPARAPGLKDYVTACTCGKWLIRVVRYRKPTYWRHGPGQ